MVGMARCAVPVAERSVRRRNEPPATCVPPPSVRPLDPGGNIAARWPCHAVTVVVPRNGRDGALRRPRRRAERQATERTTRDVRPTTIGPPAERGREHRGAMALPRSDGGGPPEW